jgi:autotransporter-associated beta strand protein
MTNGGTNGGDGGATYFESNADGGNARAITNGNGIFDIEFQTNASGMHIGSIEGSGTYYLGANTLITGGNNLSTTVSGVIANGQFSVPGAGGGALTKTGTGTLTLTGLNTYTGPTTVSAGTLQIGDGISGDLAAVSLVKISPGAKLALNLSNGDSFANSVANSGHLVATGTGN